MGSTESAGLLRGKSKYSHCMLCLEQFEHVGLVSSHFNRLVLQLLHPYLDFLWGRLVASLGFEDAMSD